jgi:hypothetical protein
MRWPQDMVASIPFWRTIDTQNNAEGQKFSQSEPSQSRLQRIKILKRIIQMRNGEEMGSNGWIEAEIWQFGYLGNDWHTKQCRRSKIQPKRARPNTFTMHKNTQNDHTDEALWRDGVKQTNRSQDMAVCVFGVRLTHKTVQKVPIAAKTSSPKAVSNAQKYSKRSYRWGMVKGWGQTDE